MTTINNKLTHLPHNVQFAARIVKRALKQKNVVKNVEMSIGYRDESLRVEDKKVGAIGTVKTVGKKHSIQFTENKCLVVRTNFL